MKIILLGAPGSGKGTQAAYISNKYDLPHISTGDIFRDNIERETPIGIKVKQVMDTGNLCPDDLTVSLVIERISRKDCQNGYILDGFPRNLLQAKELDKISQPDVVINIKVDFEKITHRITGRRSCPKCKGSFHVDVIGDASVCPTCGDKLIIRKDDNEQTVKSRLEVYEKQTLPLVKYYKEQKKLVDIDGNVDVDQVFSQIAKVLGE